MATVTNPHFLRRHEAPRRAPSRAGRTEVCPPGLPRQRWWQALVGWLTATSLHEAVSGFWSTSRPRVPTDDLLESARYAFFDAIDDIDTRSSITLAEAIDKARTRQDLWHLRAEVFALVSAHRDQAEAEHRLAGLNRFFPTRAPRSGFAPLEHPR